MKVNLKSILTLLLIVAMVIAAVSFFTQTKEEDKFVYSDLVGLFEEDLVSSFTVDGDWNMVVKAYKVATDENGNKILEIDHNGNGVFDSPDENGGYDKYRTELDKNGNKIKLPLSERIFDFCNVTFFILLSTNISAKTMNIKAEFQLLSVLQATEISE